MLCVIAKLNETAREELMRVQEAVVPFGLKKKAVVWSHNARNLCGL